MMVRTVKTNEGNDLKYQPSIPNHLGDLIQHPIKKRVTVTYDENGNPISITEKNPDELEYFTEKG